MDDTPIGEAAAPSAAERASDLAILEALEVELAEVEAALHRLDASEPADPIIDTDGSAPDFDPQT